MTDKEERQQIITVADDQVDGEIASSNTGIHEDDDTAVARPRPLSPPRPPKIGPEPTILSRKQVDTLYEIFDATTAALANLNVQYIVTGGSLLGSIRQHSILFCDDDIDIAIIEVDGRRRNGTSVYETVVVPNLQRELGNDFVYQIRPWEGGDRIRCKRKSNVFLDLFVLRRYKNFQHLVKDVLGKKKNGQIQPQSYVDKITAKIKSAMIDDDGDLDTDDDDGDSPFWHFSTRKPVEMWPKEVYRDEELFPLKEDLKFGPFDRVSGPRMPVTLLKRAFGHDCFDVYYQSQSHCQTKEQNIKHKNNNNDQSLQDRDQNNGSLVDRERSDDQIIPVVVGEVQQQQPLPPLVSPGGTWEGGQKVPLDDIHYIPMQPIARASRRPTMHCKSSLMEYLEKQTAIEEEMLYEYQHQHRKHSQSQSATIPSLPPEMAMPTNVSKRVDTTRPNRTVYTDGVFDLFHGAHLKAIEQCAALGNRVIIGVTGDDDATSYKRKPIVPQEERAAIVNALSVVDKVVCPCPLVVTQDFMDEYKIDLVVHGFANDADVEKQREFFEYPMQVGKFLRTPYTHGICTTDRIQLIQDMADGNSDRIENRLASTSPSNRDSSNISKPQWFGSTLARASSFASEIPTDPFPLAFRVAIEPHIDKARKRRQEALTAIRLATGESTFDNLLSRFKRTLGQEGDLQIDPVKFQTLIGAFYESARLNPDVDLSRLHDYITENTSGLKLQILRSISENHSPFQEAYDSFVRSVCVPHFISLTEDAASPPPEEVYYQSFPCIRIIQPDEFSIGPHADVSYGHHPLGVNFYLPLTSIGGASSLFLESRTGAEDWHCITQDLSVEGSLPTMKHFAGAICLHWTTDNKTPLTRVSLDFRLISADSFNTVKCGGYLPGGQLDVYRSTPGYYSKCLRRKSTVDGRSDNDGWERVGPLLRPDARVGFPWTVKNWEKFMMKHGVAGAGEASVDDKN